MMIKVKIILIMILKNEKNNDDDNRGNRSNSENNNLETYCFNETTGLTPTLIFITTILDDDHDDEKNMNDHTLYPPYPSPFPPHYTSTTQTYI